MNPRAVVLLATRLLSFCNLVSWAKQQSANDSSAGTIEPTTQRRSDDSTTMVQEDQTAEMSDQDGGATTAGFDTTNPGGAVAQAGDAQARAGNGMAAQAGDAEARAGETRAEGDRVAAEGAEGQDNRQQVTLQVEGTPGAAFTGRCLVGDRGVSIGGEVPQRFTYALDGRQLDCEIRKEAANTATLKVVLRGNDPRIVQSTTAQGGTIELACGRGGVSSATISATSSNQQVISSSSSVSVTSVSVAN